MIEEMDTWRHSFYFNKMDSWGSWWVFITVQTNEGRSMHKTGVSKFGPPA